MRGVEKKSYPTPLSPVPANHNNATENVAPAALEIRDAHREVQSNRVFVRTQTGTRYERPLLPIAHGSFGEIYPARNVVTQEIMIHKDIRIEGPKRGKTAKQDLQNVFRECAFLYQAQSPMLPRAILVTPKQTLLDRFRVGTVLQHAILPQRLAESDLSRAASALYSEALDVRHNVGAYVCAKVFGSLAAFHEAGMLHLDIKPENVVSDAKGALHLHDMGLSRIKGEPASRGVSGTAPFLAPELASAHGGRLVPYSEASDAWAAALTCLAVVAPEAWMHCQAHYFGSGTSSIRAAQHFTADFGAWHRGAVDGDAKILARYTHFTELFGDAIEVLTPTLGQGLLAYTHPDSAERPLVSDSAQIFSLTETAYTTGVAFFTTHRPLGDAARAAFAFLDQLSSQPEASPSEAPEAILEALDVAWHG